MYDMESDTADFDTEYILNKLRQIMPLCPLSREKLIIHTGKNTIIHVFDELTSSRWCFSHYKLAKLIGDKTVTCDNFHFNIQE